MVASTDQIEKIKEAHDALTLSIQEKQAKYDEQTSGAKELKDVIKTLREEYKGKLDDAKNAYEEATKDSHGLRDEIKKEKAKLKEVKARIKTIRDEHRAALAALRPAKKDDDAKPAKKSGDAKKTTKKTTRK